MKSMFKKRPVILACLLTAAVACYGLGMTLGASVLIGIGVLLELSFWVGLFRKKG